MSLRRDGGAAGPSAEQAKLEAQRIAFGPMVFHAAEALAQLGILQQLWVHDRDGLLSTELEEQTRISSYGVELLCQAGLSAGILEQDSSQRLRLSKVGYFLLHDPMTRANFEFVRDVCYTALPSLTQSVATGKPMGLAALLDRAQRERTETEVVRARGTVYEHLLELPKQTQASWLQFDHFYSDQAFAQALPRVLEAKPRTLLDVGANTGRFAERCLAADPELSLLLVDHAPQLAVALRALGELGHAHRVRSVALDLLALAEREEALPGPVDAVWLSQIIDCLAPAQAVAVLSAARRALAPGGRVWVLEPCLDKQPQPTGTFCLAQTSLYFACVANGTSRMYDAATLTDFLLRAGLTLNARHDGLGVGHSLFEASSSSEAGSSFDVAPALGAVRTAAER